MNNIFILILNQIISNILFSILSSILLHFNKLKENIILNVEQHFLLKY